MTVIVTFTAQASGVTTNTAIIQGAYFQGLGTPVDAGPASAAVTFSDVDFGDAPDPTYPTLLASNGARHLVIPGFFLGALIDGELDGQPNPTATGDDLANLADEDGITFLTPLVPGQQATIQIISSAAGKLDAWIDWNGDGDWNDPGEKIFNSVNLLGGLQVANINVPVGATLGQTFARFRLSSAGGLAPTGFAPDGEVEDYQVDVVQPDLTLTKDDGGITATPGSAVVYTLTLANVSANGDAPNAVISDTVPLNSVFNATLSSAGWTCANGAPAGTVCTLPVGTVAASVSWHRPFRVTQGRAACVAV
jgi:uncharacterized repeat protein (TIGR01451 family)